MDNFVDIKQEVKDEERKDFINKIKGSSPVRGKTIKIKKPKKIVPPEQSKESVTLADKSPVVTGRLNEKFIDLLDEVALYMTKKGEHFRSRAYQKAQETIINYPEEINASNYQQLVSLPNIGETIVKKFKEYITTGDLRLLVRERADPKNIFSEIYGIGPKKAESIVEKGITTIAQLREKQDELLNPTQKIGLKHYEDILKRIPRSEIDQYYEIFEKVFNKIKSEESKFEIVGSYRRGAKTSGDIDVIITGNKDNFKQFIDQLLEDKIIVELLTRGSTKSLVVAKLPDSNVVRRVDFLYASKEEYPFAILYFTGSKVFNTVMRGRALSLGYSLNEHGLYKMEGKKKGAKIEQAFPDEESIFAFLKMKYKEPNQRINGKSVEPLEGSPKLEVPPLIVPINVEKKKTKILTRKNKEEKKKEKEEEKLQKQLLKDIAKKEKEEEKKRIKQEKEDAKTRKKRAKEEEKLQKKQEKEQNKIEKKQNKHNVTKKIRKMPTTRSGKSTEKTSALIVNSKDPILQVIENYKSGGISVLENLNEKTLNEMLLKTNEVYRNLGPNEQPLISDNQYDILEDYIKEKYPKNEVVGKIGAPVAKNKIKLPYEMASMDKIKPDTKALPTWKSKYSGPYVLSCKLDGVSGLYTTESENAGLYTRGDGKIGQDVSHFISYLNLPKIKGIVVRGEFIMKKKTFETKYAKKFANARNLIAGTVNRITINDTVDDMDFVAYEVIKPVVKPSEQMKFLQDNGFITVRNETKKDITNDLLSELLVDWRNNYDYEIDGIIVTDDKIYGRKSGNPDHSFAFKMALSEQMAEAKVLDVEWNASKDGYLKPKVRIEPVKLGGVTIVKATGFNGAFIESNKIGVGAVIQIIRSGDVIPYIRSVITPADQPLMPTVDYVWNESHVDIMLENKNDDENVRNRNIIGFLKGIEVDKLGDKNVIKIIDAGFDSIPKILKMTKEQLLTIDGFKEKMANNIHDGIKTQIEKASLSKIMSSSNMFGRGFSDKKIELILTEYPDILTSNESETNKIDKLSKVKGMAKKTAEAFVKQIPEFLVFLRECQLESKLIISEKQNEVVVDESHPLYKKSIVMSGTRDKELEKKLKEVGANVSTSVTSNTFAVITPDPNSDTGKVANAKKLNVPLFTPEKFKETYTL